MAKSRLTLSTILKHLDQRNLEVYHALSSLEAERKELDRLLSYLLPLWMSGAVDGRDQAKIAFHFNAHVNLSWWELDGHPELRAKLLAAIGLGHAIRHDYQARVRHKTTMLADLLSLRYHDIRKTEIQLWCSKNSEAELNRLCSDYGIQDKDRQVIIDEYRNLV